MKSLKIKYSFLRNEHEANCTFGDINMFLTEEGDAIEGEVSIMIALKEYRRKGHASNIVKCFINLLRAELGVTNVSFSCLNYFQTISYTFKCFKQVLQVI